MRTKLIVSHKNEVRESCWTLIQQDDGTLHVNQQAAYLDGTKKERTVPINDFIQEGGPPTRALQGLIDQMFGDQWSPIDRG